MNNNCEHQRLVKVKREIYNDYTSEYEIDYEWIWVSAYEDVDVHRSKCTLCGKVSYYSVAAEDYYVKGIQNGLITYK